MDSASEGRPRLFAAYLGGNPAPGRLGEDHEVVFVVATDLAEARTAAKKKWTGDDPRPHVDAVRTLEVVDGFSITLEPSDLEESTLIDPLTYLS